VTKTPHDRAQVSTKRSLIALAVLAAVATIFWFFYSAQPHPAGTLGYDYLATYPSFLALLAAAGAFVLLRTLVKSRNK
jgi:Na+/melibiose symporter-like transporter